MAIGNFLFDQGREGFLAGDIDWDSGLVKVQLVDDNVYGATLGKIAADKFFSSIPSGARVGTATVLPSTSVGSGIAGAGQTTISAVSGAQVEALVIFSDTGNPATSRLIAWIDTATGLPLLPNGSAITINWDTGVNKIFKL